MKVIVVLKRAHNINEKVVCRCITGYECKMWFTKVIKGGEEQSDDSL